MRDIAKQALREINEKTISDKSIEDALFSLEKIKLDDGIIKASENIRDEYYDLCNYIKEMYNNHQKQSKKDISNEIADAIMGFTDKLRKELGIPK